MSRKTEPRLVDRKKGNCRDCEGCGTTGMYQDRCNYCNGTGSTTPQPQQESEQMQDKQLKHTDKSFCYCIIDQEDVKDMQVNKYKLGKQIAEFESLFGGKRVFKIIPKTGGRLDIFEEDLVDWGATPLIESKPGVLQKLGKEAVLEVDFANTPDEKPWYRDLFVINSKINELVDAVNVLQKGK